MGIFIIALWAICVLTFAVKCTISLVETAGRTLTASDAGNNREQRPVSWTSYACKELNGTIIKDPKYPDFYFDLRIMCKMCMGSGKLSEHAVGSSFLRIIDAHPATERGTKERLFLKLTNKLSKPTQLDSMPAHL